MAWSKDHSKRAMIAAEMAEAERLLTETEREATEEVRLETLEVMNANKTRWLPAVDTATLRDSTYPNPQNGDTVRVTEEASVYRFDSDSGWVKTDEYNPAVVDSLMAHITEKASKSAYGHIKVGDGLNVTDGVVSADASTVQDASTSQKGIVQLEDSINSTSTTKAATPNAIKIVKDSYSNVLNYGVATQIEAETGTSDVKYMTPLKTKQAIEKFAPVEKYIKIAEINLANSPSTIVELSGFSNYKKIRFKGLGIKHSHVSSAIVDFYLNGLTANFSYANSVLDNGAASGSNNKLASTTLANGFTLNFELDFISELNSRVVGQGRIASETSATAIRALNVFVSLTDKNAVLNSFSMSNPSAPFNAGIIEVWGVPR